MSRDALPDGPAAPGLLALDGPRPRLLVVDDHAANVQALYRVFAADHQVLAASSGARALEVCRDKRPDLVLLDVVMPDMDGYEVCARIKADPEMRDTPVIFVTGERDEEAETRGLDAGAVDFITKPIQPRIVRARVRTHVLLKRHADRLQQIALVDGLTGVANRRRFDQALDVEMRRCMRGGRPLAVLMIDVDHFKRYNDTFGHGAGDDCLRQVAQALQATITRPGDLLARWGGEEFAAVLPETEHAGALAVGEMLCNRVRRLQLAHPASPSGPVVTVSIGVATADGLASVQGSALLAAADAQLYRAKQAGRDRVEGRPLGHGLPSAG